MRLLQLSTRQKLGGMAGSNDAVYGIYRARWAGEIRCCFYISAWTYFWKRENIACVLCQRFGDDRCEMYLIVWCHDILDTVTWDLLES